MNKLAKLMLINKHGTMTDCYDDHSWNLQASYEAAHYIEYGELPEDGWVIDRVVSGARPHLFIHRDIKGDI